MTNKPVIKLRPKTRRIEMEEPISPNLSEKLQTLSKKNTTPAMIGKLDLEQLASIEDEFYRPKKKQISIRMDADLLAWFQAQPEKYQKLINKACRVYMKLKQQELKG